MRLPAISACSLDTGRSGTLPIVALASATMVGIPSSLPVTDASRWASGANSRASSGCRPLPTR